MKLSSNEEYGLRCLLRLGYEGAGASLTLPEISQAEGVSEAYAAKIMRSLRRGGFVQSARGKIGGYTLARPASQIVLGDVIEELGGRFFENDFCDRHAGQMESCAHSGVDCSVRSLWKALQVAVDEVLRKTTLQDLMRDERQMDVIVTQLGGMKIAGAPNPQ
jgi:Rrf2 family iron-sulfur cluster assembly transcriptional regulator